MSSIKTSSETTTCTNQSCRAALAHATMLTDFCRKQWFQMYADLDRAQRSRTPVDVTNSRGIGPAESSPERNALIQQRDAALRRAEKAMQNADDLSTKLANLTREKSIIEDEKARFDKQLTKCHIRVCDMENTIVRMTAEVEHEMEAHEVASAEVDELKILPELFLGYISDEGLESVRQDYRSGVQPPASPDSGSGEDENNDENEDEGDGIVPTELTSTEKPSPTTSESTETNQGSPYVSWTETPNTAARPVTQRDPSAWQLPEPEREPVGLFHTTGVIVGKGGACNTNIEQIVVDSGASFNFIPTRVAYAIGLEKTPISALSIGGYDGKATTFGYATYFVLDVAGVRRQILAYLVDTENVSHTLLLSRSWLKSVHAAGDYAEEQYFIQDEYDVSPMTALPRCIDGAENATGSEVVVGDIHKMYLTVERLITDISKR